MGLAGFEDCVIIVYPNIWKYSALDFDCCHFPYLSDLNGGYPVAYKKIWV